MILFAELAELKFAKLKLVNQEQHITGVANLGSNSPQAVSLYCFDWLTISKLFDLN